MNILIMGGTQFVGKSLAEFMIKEGHKVFIFTRNKIEIDFNGYEHHFIGDRKNISDLMQLKGKEFDIVFDISAYVKGDIENLIEVLDTKYLKKYIFCSTGAVYNSNNIPIKENDSCGFNQYWGQYGLDKLQAERILLKKAMEKKFLATIIRPTYIYGRGNNLYRESYFFDRIEQGKIIPIPDSEERIQHIYIDDLIRIFNAVIYRSQMNNEIYNVTNSQKISWEYYVECVAKAVGKNAIVKKVKYKNKIKDREFFPFRDYTYLLDISLLQQSNIPIPQISLEEGMKLSYEWYIKQEYIKKDDKMTKIECAINM